MPTRHGRDKAPPSVWLQVEITLQCRNSTQRNKQYTTSSSRDSSVPREDSSTLDSTTSYREFRIM